MIKKNKKNNRHRKSNNHKHQSQQTNQKKKTSHSFNKDLEEKNNDIDLLSKKMNSTTLNSEKFLVKSGPLELNEQPSGLPNLGNTCYFNSVMQVLGQTYVIHHMLKERCYEEFIWNAKTFFWDEKSQSFASDSLNLKLPKPNSLILNFLQLQQQIFQKKSTNPQLLLSDIQREKQQFEGFAQQDAQELLITLLDALRKAENVRQQKALIEGLKIKNTKNPSEEDRDKAQRYKITAKHTVVDAVFGGQLLSIIHCTVCDYRSFTFDPFIDLALSLDSDKQQVLSINNYTTEILPSKSKSKSSKKKSGKKKDESDTSSDESSLWIKKQIANNELDDIDIDKEMKRPMSRAKRRKLQRMQKMKNVNKTIQNEKNNIKLIQDNNNTKEENCENLNGNISAEENMKDNHEETQMDLSTDKVLNIPADNDDQYLSQNESMSPFNETETSISSNSSPSNRIKNNFRYKFFLFVHQRMSYSDDEYQNLDLGTLLRSFIKEETLDGPNKYLCENCSKLNNGEKTYSKAIRCHLIALPPPILILQLKRFEACGFNKRIVASMHKLNTKISFPEKLYLSPYTSRIYEYFSRFYEPECQPDEISDCNEQRLEYTLYGVVKHSGSLRFGHYMAYVCVRKDRFDFSTIKRFLHLKPFVSNIEHILHVVHEDLIKKEESANEILVNNISNYEEDDLSNFSSNVNEQHRKWYFISDSNVAPTTLETVLKDTVSPYLLFYERTK